VTDDARERSEGAALIRRMANGDRQAFSNFYARYAATAFALIRRILVQEAEAEDVLQEVFWQVWSEAGKYDERRGSPKAWLLNRARSRAIDKLRSIRRRDETFVMPLNEEIPVAPGSETRSPETTAGDRRMIQTALALLPDPQRRVIELAYYQGLTHAEIARHLGEPLGTVKTRMRAGMERLRNHFLAVEGGAS
jgi:RNA polymerase sigma-70 factor (ECF subfamily)